MADRSLADLLPSPLGNDFEKLFEKLADHSRSFAAEQKKRFTSLFLEQNTEDQNSNEEITKAMQETLDEIYLLMERTVNERNRLLFQAHIHLEASKMTKEFRQKSFEQMAHKEHEICATVDTLFFTDSFPIIDNSELRLTENENQIESDSDISENKHKKLKREEQIPTKANKERANHSDHFHNHSNGNLLKTLLTKNNSDPILNFDMKRKPLLNDGQNTNENGTKRKLVLPKQENSPCVSEKSNTENSIGFNPILSDTYVGSLNLETSSELTSRNRLD